MRSRTKFFLTASVVSMAATGAAASPAGAVTTTLSATADTYARADEKRANFGTEPSLRVDGSPATVAYLKFDVPNFGGPPTSAVLKVFRRYPTATGITLRPVVENDWTETTLDWTNRPATGTTVIKATESTTDGWLSYDVTALVQTHGFVSFALDTGSGVRKTLRSREETAFQPQLVLDSVPLGEQPAVQEWLKGRETLVIELNNALVPFVQNTVDDAACHRLADAAHNMSVYPEAPHPRLDELARAGLASFEEGAAECLEGDYPDAVQLVTQGLAERTAAQDDLDALLQGG